MSMEDVFERFSCSCRHIRQFINVISETCFRWHRNTIQFMPFPRKKVRSYYLFFVVYMKIGLRSKPSFNLSHQLHSGVISPVPSKICCVDYYYIIIIIFEDDHFPGVFLWGFKPRHVVGWRFIPVKQMMDSSHDLCDFFSLSGSIGTFVCVDGKCTPYVTLSI